MFSWCSKRRAEDLLGPDNIQRLHNDAGDIELHWSCRCGQTGVKRFNNELRPDDAT